MIDLIEIGKDNFLKYVKFDALKGSSTSDITLKFIIFDRFYSKTIPFKDAQDINRVKNKWLEVFELFNKDFLSGNVPDLTKKENDMSVQEKLDQLNAVALELVAEAKAEVIAAIPADGAQPVIDTTPYSEEQMAAVKAELVLAQEQIAKVMADDVADKTAIASLQEKLAKIAAILI